MNFYRVKIILLEFSRQPITYFEFNNLSPDRYALCGETVYQIYRAGNAKPVSLLDTVIYDSKGVPGHMALGIIWPGIEFKISISLVKSGEINFKYYQADYNVVTD